MNPQPTTEQMLQLSLHHLSARLCPVTNRTMSTDADDVELTRQQLDGFRNKCQRRCAESQDV